MCISKGSYGYGEAKKAFALPVEITHLALPVCQDIRFHPPPYMSSNRNLGKFGTTNLNGIVFALRHCVYEKEAMGTERIKIHSLCRCI